MGPGATVFTRTLDAASSCAIDRDSPSTAYFDAAYAEKAPKPRRPATEELLMIEPPRSMRCGIWARIECQTPSTFTSKIFRMFS